MSQDAFDAWIAGLESRHFAELTFPEVSRALRALSSTYVERRQKLSEGAALAGAGKRAAFALFYAPLHYLLVEHIVAHLDGAVRKAPTLVDLGCGTGASGVAWARAFSAAPRVHLSVFEDPQGAVRALTLGNPDADSSEAVVSVPAGLCLRDPFTGDSWREANGLVRIPLAARAVRLLTIAPT